ncbi:hypothetical protein AMECASPLE_000318 [Ameca splendens]|uniref:Uncharacterized protein n=1 Tax=Ameca splendens TaxID=208324 RepID=A0ABV0Z6H3_9TELE
MVPYRESPHTPSSPPPFVVVVRSAKLAECLQALGDRLSCCLLPESERGLDRLALLNTAGNLPDNPTSHSQKIERAPLCRLPVAISEGFSSPCSRLYITHSGVETVKTLRCEVKTEDWKNKENCDCTTHRDALWLALIRLC